jgi:hypothetical protein
MRASGPPQTSCGTLLIDLQSPFEMHDRVI